MFASFFSPPDIFNANQGTLPQVMRGEKAITLDLVVPPLKYVSWACCGGGGYSFCTELKYFANKGSLLGVVVIFVQLLLLNRKYEI